MGLETEKVKAWVYALSSNQGAAEIVLSDVGIQDFKRYFASGAGGILEYEIYATDAEFDHLSRGFSGIAFITRVRQMYIVPSTVHEPAGDAIPISFGNREIAVGPAATVILQSYTVPAGTVLKIYGLYGIAYDTRRVGFEIYDFTNTVRLFPTGVAFGYQGTTNATAGGGTDPKFIPLRPPLSIPAGVRVDFRCRNYSVLVGDVSGLVLGWLQNV